MSDGKWPSLPITQEWVEAANEAMRARDLKQAQLARLIGEHESTVSRVLTRKKTEHYAVTPISRELGIPTSTEMMAEQRVSDNELCSLALELHRLDPDQYAQVTERVRNLVESLRFWRA